MNALYLLKAQVNCQMTDFFSIISLSQESKKHLAGLGTLGLGSLITEITASEEEDQEENRDSGSVDAEGEDKYMMDLFAGRNRMD